MSRLLISLMRLRLIQMMRLQRGIQALRSPITSRSRMVTQWKWSHYFGCLILSIGTWIDPKQASKLQVSFLVLFLLIFIHLYDRAEHTHEDPLTPLESELFTLPKFIPIDWFDPGYWNTILTVCVSILTIYMASALAFLSQSTVRPGSSTVCGRTYQRKS